VPFDLVAQQGSHRLADWPVELSDDDLRFGAQVSDVAFDQCFTRPHSNSSSHLPSASLLKELFSRNHALGKSIYR
jgi:hypothetical protein